MSPGEFAALARDIQYKPGWSIDVSYDPSFRTMRVLGVASVEDAYGGGPTQILRQEMIDVPFIESFDTRHALDFFHRFITSMEHHEIGEWFRYQGARPFDPHRREAA